MSIARRCSFLLALFLLVGLSVFAAPPGKGWTITELPSLASTRPFAVATGVNARGDVVGWSYIYDASINSNRGYAVLWRDGIAIDLGEGSAQAVNDRGHIAGSVVGGLSIWSDGSWTHLGMGGAPFAINKFDALAGWFFGGQSHAYVYADATNNFLVNEREMLERKRAWLAQQDKPGSLH